MSEEGTRHHLPERQDDGVPRFVVDAGKQFQTISERSSFRQNADTLFDDVHAEEKDFVFARSSTPEFTTTGVVVCDISPREGNEVPLFSTPSQEHTFSEGTKEFDTGTKSGQFQVFILIGIVFLSALAVAIAIFLGSDSQYHIETDHAVPESAVIGGTGTISSEVASDLPPSPTEREIRKEQIRKNKATH